MLVLLLLSVAVLGYTEVTNQRIIIERDLFTGAPDVAQILPVYQAVRQRLKEACNFCIWGRDSHEMHEFCAPCATLGLDNEMAALLEENADLRVRIRRAAIRQLKNIDLLEAFHKAFQEIQDEE
jgi:hypothetical protein